MMVQVTDHGSRRVRERVGIPKRAVARLADRAMADGASHAQFTGSMKRYLDAIYMDHGSANNMRILNGYLFLFADERLVTCWLLPERFRRTKPKAVGEKTGERHPAAQGQECGLPARDRSSTERETSDGAVCGTESDR